MIGEPESFETRIGNVEQSGPEDFGQGGEGSRPGSKFRVLGHIRARQVVEDLFLDPLVQRHDIRDVTRDGINRASKRDVQGRGHVSTWEQSAFRFTVRAYRRVSRASVGSAWSCDAWSFGG